MSQQTDPINRGQRVFTCGHSFHAAFIPKLLSEIAESANIKGHRMVGVSEIGASRAIAHFQIPDPQNQAKAALIAGKVDVLTLSCMTQPDEGISQFAKLAVEHNPNVRVTLQELWLPEDRFPFDPGLRVRKSPDEFNGSTMADLKKPHAAYFKVMEDYVSALNAEIGKPLRQAQDLSRAKPRGKQSVFIVPDAQATLALRERIIAGTAPGLKKQSDLFTDAWGHPSPPLKLLSAYCHFSVIYRRSPIGLPLPSVLASNPNWNESLNRLLQELAWDAVVHHPLSGVRVKVEPK